MRRKATSFNLLYYLMLKKGTGNDLFYFTVEMVKLGLGVVICCYLGRIYKPGEYEEE